MLLKLLKKLPSKFSPQLLDVGYPFCILFVNIAVDAVDAVFTFADPVTSISLVVASIEPVVWNIPLVIPVSSLPSPCSKPKEPVEDAEPLIFTASGNKTLSLSASVLKSVSPSLSLIWTSIWFPPLLKVTRCGASDFLCRPKN